MSVETVAAVDYGLPEDPEDKIRCYSSYLDPRGGAGPTIIDSNGVTYGPPDARNCINPDLNRIALLNGFTLAPFGLCGHPYNHQYYDENSRDWISECLPAPAKLDQNQKQEGNTALDRMHTWNDPYITPTNFEYAAYVALKQALKDIKTRNSDRSNYKVYHKVYVKRTGAGIRDPEFELDVVAVLGYQIVVVSCTLHNKKGPIKEKGMEVILRSRQLGGDEAQAIVLCKAHPRDAERIERELHDEVGSAGAPLRVWGTDKWTNLSDKFYDYLQNDLHWQ